MVLEYCAHIVHPHVGKYFCFGRVVGDTTCICILHHNWLDAERLCVVKPKSHTFKPLGTMCFELYFILCSSELFQPDTVYNFPELWCSLILTQQQIAGFISPSRISCKVEPSCFPAFHLVLGSGASVEYDLEKKKKMSWWTIVLGRKWLLPRTDTNHKKNMILHTNW